MFSRAPALAVDGTQRHQLEALARAGTTPRRTARKCRVILLASRGVSNHAIAQQTGLSRPTIVAARAAFAERGIEALSARHVRQRSRRVLSAELEQTILDTTLKTRPADGTHWSVRVLARKLGVARMLVQRVWHRYDIQPHRVEKFKISNDPRFEARCGTWSGSTFTRLIARSSSASMKRARFRRSIVRLPSCPCGLDCPNGRHTTIGGTARPPCLPPSTS